MSYQVKNPIKYNFFASIPALSGKKMTAGEAIRRYRKAHNLSRDDLVMIVEPYAKEYGVRFTKYDLQNYENCKISPKTGKMTALCRATGMSIGYYNDRIKIIHEPEEIVFAA